MHVVHVDREDFSLVADRPLLPRISPKNVPAARNQRGQGISEKNIPVVAITRTHDERIASRKAFLQNFDLHVISDYLFERNERIDSCLIFKACMGGHLRTREKVIFPTELKPVYIQIAARRQSSAEKWYVQNQPRFASSEKARDCIQQSRCSTSQNYRAVWVHKE